MTICLNKPAKCHPDDLFKYFPETFPLRRPPFLQIYPLPVGASGLVILTQDIDLFKRSAKIKRPFRRVYEFEIKGKFSGMEAQVFQIIRGKLTERLENLIPKPIFEEIDQSKGKLQIFDYKPDAVESHLLALRHEPKKVKRIGIGEFLMRNLKEGEWRELLEEEIVQLTARYYTEERPEKKIESPPSFIEMFDIVNQQMTLKEKGLNELKKKASRSMKEQIKQIEEEGESDDDEIEQFKQKIQ